MQTTVNETQYDRHAKDMLDKIHSTLSHVMAGYADNFYGAAKVTRGNGSFTDNPLDDSMPNSNNQYVSVWAARDKGFIIRYEKYYWEFNFNTKDKLTDLGYVVRFPHAQAAMAQMIGVILQECPKLELEKKLFLINSDLYIPYQQGDDIEG